MNATRNPHEVRVVITGLGTINPIGNTVAEFWDNLIAGKSGIRRIKNFDIGDFDVQIAGEVDLPDDLTTYFKKKKMIKRLDRFIIFGHIAGVQALRDSGIEPDREPERIGALIGTGDGGLQTNYDNIVRITERGMNAISPFYVVSAIPNMASGYFAKEMNLQGPNFSLNSACATGNHAIGVAAMMIKMGLADVMFAGGAEAVVAIPSIAAFAIIDALSERNDSPETASRPFDKDRDGFILAEGAGVLCLEELEHAKKRGAKIYAELKGFGFSCDAHDVVAPHPEGKGAAAAMKAALDSAKLNIDDIDLINAHGTSTPIGDFAESKAICALFGEKVKTLPVHSTKSMTGHLLGAAGGAEAIAAILALEKGIIHPSVNLFQKDPKIQINVVTEPTEKKVKTVFSNNFGFGGQNASIILSKFEE